MKVTKKLEWLGLAGVCAGIALTTGCKTIYSEDCTFGSEEAQLAGKEVVAPAPAPVPAGENPMPAALSPVQPGNVVYPAPVEKAEEPYWKQTKDPYDGLIKDAPKSVDSGTAKANYITYKVQNGDTLGGIAVKHGVSLKEVKALNAGMNYDRIKVGQTVYLPAKAKAGSAPTATKATLAQDGTYVVKNGDILGRIARQFGVKVSELKAANNLSSDMIKVGQKLVIPGKQFSNVKPAKKDAKPATKKPAAPAVKPVAAPAVKPVAAPAVKPVAAPAVEPVVAPAVEPVVETTAIPAPVVSAPAVSAPEIQTPAVEIEKPVAAPAPAPAAPIALRDYTVSEGQDLISIAINHSIGIDMLRKMNPGVVEPLVPGTVIKVPVTK